MLGAPVKTLSSALAVVLVALSIFASTASAHFGGEAFILVPVDHVDPGQTFDVVVADLTPGSTVVLEVVRDGESLQIGQAVSDADGHFTTTAALPADFPHGYAQLVATAEDGTQVTTWVLVGSRSEAGPPPTAPPPAFNQLLDPSVLLLVALIGGIGIALAIALIKRSATRPADRRVSPSRRVASKRRR
jgi:hypothetical protein